MNLEKTIRDRALVRLAEVFQVPVSSLGDEFRFGVDLKASFVSDFRRNELDLIHDDIHDVADKSIAKELRSERLIIRTVGDYCAYMVRCSGTKPKDVAKVLKLGAGSGQHSKTSA